MRVETHNMKIKHLNNIKNSILITSIVSLAMVFCLQIFSTNVNAAKYIFDMVPLESRFPNPNYNESGPSAPNRVKPSGGSEDVINVSTDNSGVTILNYVLPANAADCQASIKNLVIKSQVAKTESNQEFALIASARFVGPISGVNSVVPYYYPLYQLYSNNNAEQDGYVESENDSQFVVRGEFNENNIISTNFEGGIYANVKIGDFTKVTTTIPSLSGNVSGLDFVIGIVQKNGIGVPPTTITVTRPTVEIDFDETSDISKCSFMSSNTTTTNTTPPATPGMGSSSGTTENQAQVSSSSNIKAPKTGALLVSLILIPIIVAGSAYLYMAHHNQASIKKNSER